MDRICCMKIWDDASEGSYTGIDIDCEELCMIHKDYSRKSLKLIFRHGGEQTINFNNIEMLSKLYDTLFSYWKAYKNQA